MTLILKLDLDMIKMYLHTKNEVPMWSSSNVIVWADRHTDRQTDGQTDRRTDGQTDTNKNITYLHLRVVKICWFLFLQLLTFVRLSTLRLLLVELHFGYVQKKNQLLVHLWPTWWSGRRKDLNDWLTLLPASIVGVVPLPMDLLALCVTHVKW